MLTYSAVVTAQNPLSCGQRPNAVSKPKVYSLWWCLERPVLDDAGGEMAFTALTMGDSGVLYATRPLTDEVFRITDSDGDGLVDSPAVLLDNLNYPNALTYYDDALYIGGSGVIYRYADDALTVLVDDLPSGRGFLPGGLLVHDEHLYYGIPAPCDFCIPDDDRLGTVMRFDLNGSNPAIVARGLRYPAGLLHYDNRLWVTDTTRNNLDSDSYLDELNTVDLDSDNVPHFGFPYCIGGDNQPDLASDFDCASATAPIIRLPTHSVPIALAVYDNDLFRWIENDMLLVLAGASYNPILAGYQVAALQPAADAVRITAVAPADETTFAGSVRYDDSLEDGIIVPLPAELSNVRGDGFFPHRVYDVAISDEGWIYMSVGGGAIYVMRPSQYDTCELFINCDE